MILHDDARDPRDPRDTSVADDWDTLALPAEMRDTAPGLPLLEATPRIPRPRAYPLTPHALCLHKDPPLWRFGH